MNFLAKVWERGSTGARVVRRPRPEIEARRSGLCQTPGKVFNYCNLTTFRCQLTSLLASCGITGTGEHWPFLFSQVFNASLYFSNWLHLKHHIVAMLVLSKFSFLVFYNGGLMMCSSCVLPVAVDLLVVGSLVGSWTPVDEEMSTGGILFSRFDHSHIDILTFMTIKLKVNELTVVIKIITISVLIIIMLLTVTYESRQQCGSCWRVGRCTSNRTGRCPSRPRCTLKWTSCCWWSGL